MSEALTLFLAWMAGGLLGVIFFGGLWFTVRRGVSSRQPALWFFGGVLLRMSVTMTGFYLVSAGHWERLLVCLLGFIMARVAITQLTRPSGETRVRSAQEVRHAP